MDADVESRSKYRGQYQLLGSLTWIELLESRRPVFTHTMQEEAWQELASLVALGYRPGPDQYRHLVRAEAATGECQFSSVYLFLGYRPGPGQYRHLVCLETATDKAMIKYTKPCTCFTPCNEERMKVSSSFFLSYFCATAVFTLFVLLLFNR